MTVNRHAQPKPPTASGFVSLVGAGPGNPDFLTLRGLRRLQAAEVILPDALLHEDFASLYPPEALVIPCGKRCGQPSTPQAQIHSLMIHHAQRGARVVRLKNGDPLLFGRGHEEAQALAAAGVPFELVPGVSALQAGAAAAGLSLTHRGLTYEVKILQGHDLLARNPDWAELARPGPTLVLFMATRLLPAIARRLLSAGASWDLPVVLVEDASGPLETITRSQLAHAAAGHLTSLTGGPGIVYLGPAAGLRILPHAYPEADLQTAPLPGSERLPRAAGGRRSDG
jgi:uroporphyrin-III C-methyltransferase